jgi:hypothetical protein
MSGRTFYRGDHEDGEVLHAGAVGGNQTIHGIDTASVREMMTYVQKALEASKR